MKLRKEDIPIVMQAPGTTMRLQVTLSLSTRT